MGTRILVVDDEEKILEVVDSYLSHSGYEVSLARNGRDGLDAWRFYKPDLVVLDLMLPDMSGEEVCRAIRRESDTPILMLTAKSSEEAMLRGFSLGTDDYLCKPFSPRVLVARVQALLKRQGMSVPAGQDRRPGTRAHEITQGGDGRSSERILATADHRLVLDCQTLEARIDGQPMVLTVTEFRLLELFMCHPGRVFSRDSLVNFLLEDPAMVDPRTMDAHIKNLRHKLGEGPRPARGKPKAGAASQASLTPDAATGDPAEGSRRSPHEPYIQTVHGMGYRFAGGRQ